MRRRVPSDQHSRSAELSVVNAGTFFLLQLYVARHSPELALRAPRIHGGSPAAGGESDPMTAGRCPRDTAALEGGADDRVDRFTGQPLHQHFAFDLSGGRATY